MLVQEQIAEVYERMIDAWNRQDARTMAEPVRTRPLSLRWDVTQSRPDDDRALATLHDPGVMRTDPIR